jgi:hypothetical protein
MRHLRTTSGALVFGVVLVSLSQLPATAGEPSRPEAAVARVNVGPTGVDWLPAVDYERLTLTIVGPEGFAHRQELAAGQSPLFSLFKSNGERLPDGLYRYELRLLPRMKQENSRTVVNTIQRGTFLVRDGSFIASSHSGSLAAFPPAQSTPSKSRNIARKDSVVSDDLVVQGTACIGPNCVTGDPDSNTLTLKGPIPRILFHDVNADCQCLPARNWLLQANENYPEHYPFDVFYLQDMHSGAISFSVQGGAPDDALVVNSIGNVGVGTESPLQALHVVSAATPTLRLEQPVSPGPARTWDVGANASQFFVSDVTASSNQPFRIRAGAPTSSIDIASSGNVGVGTASPSNSLHVRRTDGTAQLLVEEASGTAAQRTLATFKNKGGVQLEMIDTSAFGGTGIDWVFQNVNGQARITDAGDATNEFVLDQNGNLTISGTLTQNSDRDTKRDLRPVSGDDVLARLVRLPITTWNLKTDDPAVRHMGPMAQDFAAVFALGEDERHIAPLDVAGVSLAAIQALDGKLAKTTTEKDAEIAQLRRENAQLAERLAALESAVSAMAAKNQ